MKKRFFQIIALALTLFLLISSASCGCSKTEEESPGEIALKNLYKNEEYGFSFRYPKDWSEAALEGTIAYVAAPSALDFTANLSITSEAANDTLVATEKDFKKAYAMLPDLEILSLEDAQVSSQKARKLVYTWTYDGRTLRQTQYFYILEKQLYALTFTSLEENRLEYDPVFGKMIESYTISDKE